MTQKPRATTKSRGNRTPTRLRKARLAEMIEEATVDAYDESRMARILRECGQES